MKFLPLFLLLINFLSASQIDAGKLKTIETFLSTMTTLEASMTMDILGGNQTEHFEGKIWLDRQKSHLRIDYGNNKMIASNASLKIIQENQAPQEFSTEDTPAGILLRPKIDFEKEGITVKSLIEIGDIWQLHVCYESPAGSVPITLYFKPKPVMILLGWSIQNPNQTITNVHLNPDQTHMAIKIAADIFKG